MKTFSAVLLLALVAAPLTAASSFDGQPGWSYYNGFPGLCADVLSDGPAGIRVSPVNQPDLGSVAVTWAADPSDLQLNTRPERVGLQAKAVYHGTTAGQHRHTVWIPTATEAGSPLSFRLELLAGDAIVATRTPGFPDPGNVRACAALIDP